MKIKLNIFFSISFKFLKRSIISILYVVCLAGKSNISLKKYSFEDILECNLDSLIYSNLSDFDIYAKICLSLQNEVEWIGSLYINCIKKTYKSCLVSSPFNWREYLLIIFVFYT